MCLPARALMSLITLKSCLRGGAEITCHNTLPTQSKAVSQLGSQAEREAK